MCNTILRNCKYDNIITMGQMHYFEERVEKMLPYQDKIFKL